LSADDWQCEDPSEFWPDVLEVSSPHEEASSLHEKNRLPSPAPRNLTIAAGFWYLLGQEESERHERLLLLQERCRAARAMACVTRLPPVHRLDSEIVGQIARFQENWSNHSPCPLYFEPGKDGPPPGIDPAFCVWDPLWDSLRDPRKDRSGYWKVHGWHRERWVRMYPKPTLTALAKQAERFSPKFVILGHSQRKVQYATLKSALKESENL
jgi:hypothetical protein